MMEKMDELYSRIQKMLMKMNSECGELKFMSSRITEENSKYINDICKNVEDVFKTSAIPFGENISKTDTKCIQSFKYLILNTNFQSQDQLVEDIVNGHLVDMCPPISAYLLFEILYNLKYEEILAEFILYAPLDLCNEILSMVPRCTSIMDLQRAQDFIINLILNSYKKIVSIRDKETHSLSLNEGLESLTINIQELIAVLSDKKLMRLNDFGLKKSERIGLTLRELIKLTKSCLECEQTGVTVPPDMDKLYRVTFGRDFIVKCNEEALKSHLTILNTALLLLLMKSLKDIDIKTYLSWAELETDGNSLITLQQAIGIDCYNLIEFLNDYKHLESCDSLVECLKHISAKPQAIKCHSNLEQLVAKINDGKKECLKELMSRHDTWDHTTFNCIKENISHLDKDDFSILLEYLTNLMLKPGQEHHKQTVYNTVTRILVNLKITDIYQVVIEYIINHDAGNTLESAYTEEMFKNFIFRNTNLKSPANLRILLFFLLKNPKKFLKILVKISIGCSEYKHVMIPPHDLFLLSPIMNIREENNDIMVLNTLRSIGQEITDWDTKKFSDFITAMIKEEIFTADQCLNQVFIPLIETNKLPTSSIKFAINCIRQIMPLGGDQINLSAMLMNLARIMSFLRGNPSISRFTINEILTTIIRIIKSLLHYNEKWLNAPENKSTIDKIISILHPIDQMHFYPLWYHQDPPDITDIMADYSRRVESAILRIDADNVNPLVTSTSLQTDFQHHLILNTTESEYVKIATEIVVVHWDYFQAKPAETDEYDSFIDFIKITIDTCRYCLEFPDRITPNTFGCVIKSMVKFIQEILLLENKWDYSRLRECLRHNFTLLCRSIKGTEYESLHDEALVIINNRPNQETSFDNLQEILACFKHFANKCLEAKVKVEPRKYTPEILKIQLRQDFIHDCLQMGEKYPNTIMQRFREFCASGSTK